MLSLFLPLLLLSALWTEDSPLSLSLSLSLSLALIVWLRKCSITPWKTVCLKWPLSPADTRGTPYSLLWWDVHTHTHTQSKRLKTDTYCKWASLVSEDVVNMSVGWFPLPRGNLIHLHIYKINFYYKLWLTNAAQIGIYSLPQCTIVISNEGPRCCLLFSFISLLLFLLLSCTNNKKLDNYINSIFSVWFQVAAPAVPSKDADANLM